MICPHCQNTLPDGIQLCFLCGKPVMPPSQPPCQPQNPGPPYAQPESPHQYQPQQPQPPYPPTHHPQQQYPPAHQYQPQPPHQAPYPSPYGQPHSWKKGGLTLAIITLAGGILLCGGIGLYLLGRGSSDGPPNEQAMSDSSETKDNAATDTQAGSGEKTAGEGEAPSQDSANAGASATIDAGTASAEDKAPLAPVQPIQEADAPELTAQEAIDALLSGTYYYRMQVYGVTNTIARNGSDYYYVDRESSAVIKRPGAVFNINHGHQMYCDVTSQVGSNDLAYVNVWEGLVPRNEEGTAEFDGEMLPYIAYGDGTYMSFVRFFIKEGRLCGAIQSESGVNVDYILDGIRGTVPGGIFDLPSGYRQVDWQEFNMVQMEAMEEELPEELKELYEELRKELQ